MHAKKGINTHTSKFRDRTPASMTVAGDIFDKLLIFFRRPQPSLNFLFVAAPVTHLNPPLPASSVDPLYFLQPR